MEAVGKLDINMFRTQRFRFLLLFSSVSFTCIILPLIIFFQLSILLGSSINFRAYMIKANFIFLPIIIVGIVILSFVILMTFYQPYMYSRLMLSLLSESAYIAQIIIMSLLFDVYFDYGALFVRIDLSRLYLFLIIIPALLIVRQLYNFFYSHKDYISKYHVLRIIQKAKGISNQRSLRKFISNDSAIPNDQKSALLKNLSQVLTAIETEQPPLLEQIQGKFKITQHGFQMINYFDKRYSQEDIITPKPGVEKVPLQYWTEEELRRLQESDDNA